MSAFAETAVSAVVLLGTAILTLGVGWAALARDRQLKVHALSLGAVGPLVTLVPAAIWGDGRMILAALLLIVFLVVSSSTSAHALMRLVDLRKGPDGPGSKSDADRA